MISAHRIDELANGPKVRRIAVENFLSTLGGLTVQEALGNLELDAVSYRWNDETRAAIHKGIMEHFFLNAAGAVSCCREPKVRGGRCDNCGRWLADVSGGQ